MIRFFKSTFISRPVLLVLLFLAIRLPLFFWEIPVTMPELKGMVLGERLNDGFMLYRDVFDNSGPLAAFVFQLIDFLDGRSLILYRLMAAVLLLFQAFQLNAVFNRFQVLPEKTYLPALFYVLGGSFFFEFDTLTPVLIGQTFVVLALKYLIVVSKESADNRKLFKAGFLIGLAALCYLPFGFFLAVAYFAVVFFAANTFRSFLLLLTGFCFPLAVVGLYYFYRNGLAEFIRFYFLSSGLFNADMLIGPLGLVKLFALPVALLLAGISAALAAALGLNYQQKMLQLLLIWLLAAVLMFFSAPEISAASFTFFLPALAYFSFFLFRPHARTWLLETGFLALLVLFSGIRYAVPLGFQHLLQTDASALQLKSSDKYKKIVNGQLLVLGPDFQYYAYNYAASPYLNWKIAEEEMAGLNTYEAVFDLHENLKKNPPAFIIDEVKLMPELQYHLPLLFGLYEPAGAENLYKLKTK